MPSFARTLLTGLVALCLTFTALPAQATSWSVNIADVMNLVYCVVGVTDCEGLQPGADVVTEGSPSYEAGRKAGCLEASGTWDPDSATCTSNVSGCTDGWSATTECDWSVELYDGSSGMCVVPEPCDCCEDGDYYDADVGACCPEEIFYAPCAPCAGFSELIPTYDDAGCLVAYGCSCDPYDLGDCMSDGDCADDEYCTASEECLGCADCPMCDVCCGSCEAVCGPDACGPALGIPNYECPDGTIAGPGDCVLTATGGCAWEIIECPNLCDDFVGPCQTDSDCPEGEVCLFDPETCLPSACNCDPETGNAMCTMDCGGKNCSVPDDVGDPCDEPGATMVAEDGCNTCVCSEVTGSWNCTKMYCPPCEGDGDCADGAYCDLEGCEAPGTCTPMPEVCTDEVAPVCGCDDKEFGNPCEAAASGMSVAYEGPCEGGDCPDGSEPVLCIVDPCEVATCEAYPGAQCISDTCGGCFADWYVGGWPVDCEPVEEGCETDDDCENGWCRPVCDFEGDTLFSEDGPHECVPWAEAGDTCGGYVIYCALEQCAPGLNCVSQNSLIPDLPGVCTEPVVCDGGQVYSDCGSACTKTCDDPDPMCISVCVSGCTCPSYAPIWHEGECITQDACPATSECESNDDCEDGWCRPVCEDDGGMMETFECVPWAQEGDYCGGYTLPCWLELCDPDLECQAQPQEGPWIIADLPGICGAPEGECPDGSEPVSCIEDPCAVNSCDAYPDAECVADYCGGCNAGFFVDGDLVDCTVSEPSDCCDPHIDAGCDDDICEATVCELDIWCCSPEWFWDAACVDKANAHCSVCGGEAPTSVCGDGACDEGEDCPEDCEVPPAGDCCAVHDGAGCEDATCEEAVCALDYFCCESSWDSYCTGYAADLCEVCATCTGGQEWATCGASCSASCEDPLGLCTAECVDGCMCPMETPIWHEGECITAEACPGVGGCESDDDCAAGTWCRPTCGEDGFAWSESGESECVPYAAEGEYCGGYMPYCMVNFCGDGLTCVDQDPMIIDEPGICESTSVTCEVDGVIYEPGDSFHGSGNNWCNTCSCTDEGYIQCTLMGCPDNPCVVTGCSSHLCMDGEVMSTCEWQEEYACYQTHGNCGPFGDDNACAWDPTDNLLECIEEADDGPSIVIPPLP